MDRMINEFSAPFVVLLFLGVVGANDSSIFIDWSQSSFLYSHQIRQFTVDYFPTIGHPPSHSIFPSSKLSLAINKTLPAVDYRVNVSALLTDNRRIPILSTIITSSPPRPTLEFLKSLTDEVTFAFLAPPIPNLNYYVEYYDADRHSDHSQEHVNFIETNRTALRIRQLEPNTRYKLRVFSTFNGIPSTEPLETEFKTRALVESFTTPFVLQESRNAIEESINHPDSTQQLTQTTVHRKPIKPLSLQTSGNYVTATATVMPLQATMTPDRPFYNDKNQLPHWKQPEGLEKSRGHLSELPPLELLGQVAVSLLTSTGNIEHIENVPTTTALSLQTLQTATASPSSQQPVVKLTRVVNLSKSAKLTTTTQAEDSTNTEVMAEEQSTSEPLEETTHISEEQSTPEPLEETTPEPLEETTQTLEETTPELLEETTQTLEETTIQTDIINGTDIAENGDQVKTEPDSFLDNKIEIRASKEGNQIRLEWDPPEKTICDNYLVNTTLLDAHKCLSTASANPYSYIKFYQEERLAIKVSCMSEGAISMLWSAEKFIDLNIENLRVKRKLTDEFYVASVTLDINWPLKYDPDKYEVVVVWGLGKKAVGNNKAVFNKRGEIAIEKLEAAKLYTFVVRNVSKELGIASAPIGVRQITPPVVTSTLYPGQISSYAININFGDSEQEHPFDSYELIFAGNNKNITKKLSKTDPKSFTFNKLIPGKTYTFILYTVYKNVRSRPVVEEITTYPLKVKSFNPVVGPGYVTLFWEIENVADNDCRFRLEYASTSNSGIQKSQKVKLQDTNKYRFSGLEYDTYYTFTITVLMGKEGKSEAESESEMVTIGFQGKPNSLPVLQRHGSRELQLTFENDPRLFADTNGVVDNFAVIVTEDIKLGGDDYELKSYYEVRDEAKWPAYRTSHSTYNPFTKRGSSRTAIFLIGDEDCDRRKLSEPYCNGVLRSHVDYYVKVRAYLVTKVAMETEWVSIGGLVDENPQEKGRRRLPCFMYLNGCSSSSGRRSLPSLISLFVSSITPFVYVVYSAR